jgi:hypothetical protein
VIELALAVTAVRVLDLEVFQAAGGSVYSATWRGPERKALPFGSPVLRRIRTRFPAGDRASPPGLTIRELVIGDLRNA